MLTKEELKKANNNVITIMENRVMQMTGCSRATANLVVNEILDLNEEALKLWEESKQKWFGEDKEECWDEKTKAVFSNEVLDVKDYVEKITGERPDYTTLEEMEEDFEEKEICLWNYPICEADFIVEEGFKVCLVRFTTLYGGYEYRWCELE